MAFANQLKRFLTSLLNIRFNLVDAEQENVGCSVTKQTFGSELDPNYAFPIMLRFT